jgi:HEAT repeat protein
MPVLIEHITEFVIAVLILVVLGTGALVAAAIARRQRRERYFQRIDDLRQRYKPVITAVLAQKLEYVRGVELLRGISGFDREYVLEQLCLEVHATGEEIPILRHLCEDLGLVRLWQSRLSGQMNIASLREAFTRPEGFLEWFGGLRFLLRAKSADNLGIIRHRASWPLLVKALEDSHPDVQSVAVRSLAAIQEPESFPALVQRLHDVVLKPSTRLSLRAVKTALVSFPLSYGPKLIPSLTHSHRRIRFLATDVIREIVERLAGQDEEFMLDPRDFSPALAEVFLTQLCFDENPDVRARAAPVVAYLADPRSTPVLLTLLEDAQWFVRLHTVRAFARRRFISQAAHLAHRLTDPHWMVREAAARTMLVYGQVGNEQLATHFLSTEDRYSQEQIADEMQRAGLIPSLLAQYATESGGSTGRVLERLVSMGKTSYLVSLLAQTSERSVRQKFLQKWGRSSDPQIKGWVVDVASSEVDPTLRTLAVEFLRTRVEPGA